MTGSVLLVAAVLLVGCGEEKAPAPAPAEPGQVLDADDGSFERVVEQADGPVLLLWWAPWSGPDRAVLPYMDRVAREYPDVTVVKVDTDKTPDAAARYEVVSVPTAMVVVDGEVEAQIAGAAPWERWKTTLGLDGL